jgi:hypothetical protein
MYVEYRRFMHIRSPRSINDHVQLTALSALLSLPRILVTLWKSILSAPAWGFVRLWLVWVICHVFFVSKVSVIGYVHDYGCEVHQLLPDSEIYICGLGAHDLTSAQTRTYHNHCVLLVSTLEKVDPDINHLLASVRRRFTAHAYMLRSMFRMHTGITARVTNVLPPQTQCDSALCKTLHAPYCGCA